MRLRLPFVFVVVVGATIGAAFSFDECDAPLHAHITKKPWFRKCLWECNDGYVRIIGDVNTCCLPKPSNSKWASKSSTCAFTCNTGFAQRGSNTCCKRKPEGSVWSSRKGCSWKCAAGFELDDQDECRDEHVLEVLRDSRQKATESLIDVMVDGEITEQREEKFLEIQKKRTQEYIDELLNRILEEEEAMTANGANDLSGSDSNSIGAVVENELERLKTDAQAVAAQTEAAADDYRSYLDSTCSTATPTATYNDFNDTTTTWQETFDSVVAAELEEEVGKRLASLDQEVEFLRATIRFQNERLKRRGQQLGDRKQLERDLNAARSQAEALEKRSNSTLVKLQEARKDAAKRFDRVLSVHGELIELQHHDNSGSSGSSGDRWIRIYGALLDTGNGNVCTISKRVVKDLGLSKQAASTWRSIEVLGVLPGVSEKWPLITIQLRIKGRIFKIQAAVGGTTPLLVSHPDVIDPLMKENGYVIGR